MSLALVALVLLQWWLLREARRQERRNNQGAEAYRLKQELDRLHGWLAAAGLSGADLPEAALVRVLGSAEVPLPTHPLARRLVRRSLNGVFRGIGPMGGRLAAGLESLQPLIALELHGPAEDRRLRVVEMYNSLSSLGEGDLARGLRGARRRQRELGIALLDLLEALPPTPTDLRRPTQRLSGAAREQRSILLSAGMDQDSVDEYIAERHQPPA